MTLFKELNQCLLDMRRLSDLVTTLAEKVEVQVQARDFSDDVTVERSGKRKRYASPSPPMQTENALNMRIEQLEHELSRCIGCIGIG